MAKKKSQSGGNIAPFVTGDHAHPWRGLNTAIKDFRFLDRGESPNQMNWITSRDQDHIELRRGQHLLGTTRHVSPAHPATGLGIGIRNDGVEVPFYSYDRKIFYYDEILNDTVEVGLTELPPDADGEDTNIMPYQNLAGSFVYITSKKSSIYKIATANPTYILDQFRGDGDYLFGFAKINRGRMSGMDRQGHSQSSKDTTGLYLSHIDKQLITDYHTNWMSVPQNITFTITPSGGAIPIGTYYFVMTAFGPEGVETTRSAEVGPVVITVNNSKVDLSFPSVAGATFYSIYGTTVSGTYTTPAVVVQQIPDQNAYPVNNTYTILDVGFTTGAPPSSTTQGLISPVGTGNGVQTTFVGSLPQQVIPFTNFYVVITDGVEKFTDDKNGLMIGNFGGTGTINYLTGDYSITFVSPPPNGRRLTASFYQEDATVGGICDFTIDTTDTTNAAAQIFRQDDGGGNAEAVWPYQGVEYCFHVLRSWLLNISSGQSVTVFENQPYYEQIGIPYKRAVYPTGEGILFLNNSNPGDPSFSILQIPPGSTNLTVIPVSKSQALDLSFFKFPKAVVFSFADWYILSCEDVRNGFPDPSNQITFIMNKYSGLWNKLDYSISCAGIYKGTLLTGDSLSPNLFTLFSGFDDDEEIIPNFYQSSSSDLDIPGLKTVGYISLEGLIQHSQKLEVYYQLDTGAFIYAYTIFGTGPYVSADPISVGARTVGTTVVGGGNDDSEEFAFEYEIDIPLHTDKFEFIAWMVRAVDIGYVSVTQQQWKDIRWKRRRINRYNDLEINL